MLGGKAAFHVNLRHRGHRLGRVTRVSIVIPCFNGGDMVRGAVESALAQRDADVEVVVVNDGSTDPLTVSALHALHEVPSVVVLHQENLGLPRALNRGIAESTGDYLLVLAHDDEVLPSYAAQAAAVLDTRPEVGIVYCRAERFGGSSGEWHLPEFSIGGMLFGNMIFASAMYRRADFDLVGGYSEDRSRGFEDHEFWLRLIALGREVERLDEILFRYRDTEGSLSNTMVPQDRVEAFAQIFAANSELYIDHAPEFAEVVMGHWEMLNHYKSRYGRIEKVLSRLGGQRRRVRGWVKR